MKKVIIIDYGVGNIKSLINAIEYLNYKAIVTNDSKIIKKSERLILPGVGSFYFAMSKLEKLKIVEAIKQNVTNYNGRILGICLGMQLLAEYGTEEKKIRGIGLVPGTILHLSKITKKKLPHIGFNRVESENRNGLFKDIDKGNYYYFVHSYYLENKNRKDFFFSYTSYGKKFISSYENDKICGTQFHPEKSQKNGLKIIKNFLNG